MFRGRFEHNIDSKGRLSIPARFREVLSTHFDERLVITNFDNCLWCYPVSEWQMIERKIASVSQFKDEIKALQRVFISAATEVQIDKVGRILIPPTLREYAGIEKSVVLVGMSTRIEIWSAERWKVVFQDALELLSNVGDKLADLGL